MPTAFCQTATIKNSGLEVATWAGDKTGGSKPLSRLLCQKTQTSSSKDQTEGFAFLPQISWSGGPKVTVFKLRWGTGRRQNTGLDLIFGCGYLVEFYWQRNYNPWSSPNCPGSKQGYKSSTFPPWIWLWRSVSTRPSWRVGLLWQVAIQRTCWPARSIFTIPAVGVDNHPQEWFLFIQFSMAVCCFCFTSVYGMHWEKITWV